MSGKRILVDGYNVIRRHSAWNDLFRRDMAAARKSLIQHCATMKARHRDIVEVLVFFDGDSSVAAHPTPQLPGVRVIFTATGVEADERIIEAVRSAASHSTVVVSDDAEVAGRSRTLGAEVQSVAQFVQAPLRLKGGAGVNTKPVAGKSDLTPGQERAINEELKRAFGLE